MAVHFSNLLKSGGALSKAEALNWSVLHSQKSECLDVEYEETLGLAVNLVSRQFLDGKFAGGMNGPSSAMGGIKF